MWESSEEPSGMTQNAQNARCVLGLSLDACWGKTSTLRQSKLDILGELMESKAWHVLLYDRPAEAAATVTDVMATLLEFLANPRSTPKETCRCLETISQVLRTFGSVRSGTATYNLALTPFSRRKVVAPRTPVRNLDHDTIVADNYPTVLTRLNDSNEDVRRHALQTLGDFLPFVDPDSSRTQPLSGVDREKIIAAGGATSGRMGDGAVLFFSSFVLESLTYALRTASSSECTDEVDTLLRRAACLDPEAFLTVLSRCVGTVYANHAHCHRHCALYLFALLFGPSCHTPARMFHSSTCLFAWAVSLAPEHRSLIAVLSHRATLPYTLLFHRSVSGSSDIAGAARQLLSDLADHASVLATFQRDV